MVNCKSQKKVAPTSEEIIAIGTAVREELAFIDNESRKIYSNDKLGFERKLFPLSYTYSKVTFEIDTIFNGGKYDSLEIFFHLPYPLEVEMGLQYLFRAKRGNFVLLRRDQCLYPHAFYITNQAYYRSTKYLKGFKFDSFDVCDSICRLP